MIPQCPKDCPDRRQGCHDSCDLHQEATRKRQQIAQARQEYLNEFVFGRKQYTGVNKTVRSKSEHWQARFKRERGYGN